MQLDDTFIANFPICFRITEFLSITIYLYKDKKKQTLSQTKPQFLLYAVYSNLLLALSCLWTAFSQVLVIKSGPETNWPR